MIAAIAAALALAEPSREALIERWLHANRAHSVASLNSAPRRTPVNTPDLQSLARRELRTGRYQLASVLPAPPRIKPWWERVWDWLAERWNEFWRAIFARVHIGKQQAASIGDVLLVSVGLLLIFVVVRLLMNFQPTRSDSRVVSDPLHEAPPLLALYRQACAAARSGDYGRAVLLLFSAMVALLDRQGVLNDISSATVGDLRRELRVRDSASVASFDAVAVPFVQKAYAERAIDERQWDRARAAFDRLLSPRE